MPRNNANRSRRGMTITVTILGMTLLTILLAYFVIGDSNDRDSLASVRLIGIIFRHGDRSPTELYPNDPHLHHKWPGGLGALSEKGSQQMFNLGGHLRHRYYKLLPSNGIYTKENMNVVSSAAERCLMSASAFMAGFMPPLEQRNKLPIAWQPVPITSMPRNLDYLLAQKKPCPKYDEALRQINSNGTKEIQSINAINADLFDYLTKNTGQNVTNILDVELLYNILEIEQNNGLELPAWTEQVFPRKMRPLAERNLELITETPYMKLIKGGALVTEILDQMIKKRSGKLLPERSIFVYSAHDVTLVNVMRALGIDEQTSRKPDYGATLVMELHHSVIFEEDFEVKIVYYFSSEDKFPKQLRIPNCDSPCSLTQFTVSVKSVTLRNYDEVCKII